MDLVGCRLGGTVGVALCLTASLACGAGEPAGPAEPSGAAPVVVRFDTAAPGSTESSDAVVVTGLDDRTMQRLESIAAESPEWSRIFPVYVGESPPSEHEERPTVLGTYLLEDRGVRFEPRFPFVRGQSYYASWLAWDPGEQVARATVHLAPPEGGAAARVMAVYPSAAELPENLLRFYVHFSMPMSREGAVERVRLIGPDGPLELPFVAPQVELWNPARDRLTLILDPGRTKRGVGPNTELGPVLTAGSEFRLEVDAQVLDGGGRPLVESYARSFRVVAADRRSPDPGSWELIPPAGLREPVTLSFPEALDRAMLLRAIRVESRVGRQIDGLVTVGPDERSWSFSPDAAWPCGDCRLVVDSALEDPSGNSIRRPFESRIGAEGGADGSVKRVEDDQAVVIEFTVGTAVRG